jgi:hypothetical protein
MLGRLEAREGDIMRKRFYFEEGLDGMQFHITPRYGGLNGT